MRVYANDAKVKLNQRSCKRMDLVVGLKFRSPKIPADSLLDGWMRPRRGGPIHQLEQEWEGVRHYDPNTPLEPNILISNSDEYMIRSEEISFMLFI